PGEPGGRGGDRLFPRPGRRGDRRPSGPRRDAHAGLMKTMAIRPDFAVIYVVRPQGRTHEVLQLLRRPEAYLGDTWQFPGGRLEEGETAADAAVRELKEETRL